MKKVGSLLAFLLAFIMVVTACAPTATTLASTTDPYGPPNTTTGTTSPLMNTGNDHDCTTTGTTGTTESTTSTTTDTTSTTTGTVTPKKSIKILAIGNSFSVDAMEHLGVILKGEGYDEIVLGDLYIGGCSLDTHWGNIQSGAKAYTFYTNTGDGWSEKTSDIQTGIDYADWDFITIQQVSQDSGRPETFGNLQNIIDHVKKTQPDAKIYWHMTWAYQATSSHAGFANYGKNQMNMYKAITDAVKTTILTNSSIDGVIPSGTAVQNLRLTYGDYITRDGFHLTYGLGRYTAALMWYKQLTGADITNLTAMPASAASEISKYIDDVKLAVNNAYTNPLKVTGENVEEEVDLTIMTDADKAYLTSKGLDPEKYTVLDLGPIYGAYYSSRDAKSNLNGSSNISPRYIATKIFTPQTLPAGAVVKIADGYQYRLEGWQKLDANNSVARRDNSSECFTVSADLYTSYNFVAFNISKKDNSNIVKSEDAYAFRIYVPKTEAEAPVMTEEDKAYLTSKGLNPDNYEKLDLGYTLFAYYNSTSGTTSNIINATLSNAGNLVNFLGTRIITKEEMPVGSVIRLDTGYQYRPERFVELGKAPAKRGDNIKTGHVVVDEAWWGDFNYRAFNIGRTDGAKITAADASHFRIYVPKSAVAQTNTTTE